MTSPAMPPPAEPSRPPRLLAAATWLVLATTGLVVLLVAMPALLRLGGLGPRALSGASDLPPPRPAPHPSLPGADLAGEDDEGREDGLMNLPPVPRQGGSLGADDPPGAEEPPSDEPPSARMRPAVVRRKATLHISDAEDTTATGEVQAGESVFVLREKGDWALVLRSGDEGVVMGWTEKSRLAIR